MRNATRLARRAGLMTATALLTTTLLASGLPTRVGPAAATEDAPTQQQAAQEGKRSYNGHIDGAEYRVEMPERWNGTLVLYSHGFYPGADIFPVEGVLVTNNAETETWLLDHGFALAASNYKGTYGFQVPQAQRDQLALLDWFEANVGRPRHTISMGQSMGGSIAVLLAERHPDRFDGVVGLCSAYDSHGHWNTGLDMVYAVRTLLLPGDVADDIQLSHPSSPEDAAADTATLQQAVETAFGTPEGQAKLALIASLNNVPGWWRAHDPAPTDPVQWIREQANWIAFAYTTFAGPTAHIVLEAEMGGNPSTNVGIDYRRQFARSTQTRLVQDAYRAAGLARADLQADLDRLNAAPRVAADRPAIELMYRTSIPSGRLTLPMVSLHTVGDGGAVPDHERWYAEQVRHHGRPNLLRQLFVERGQHCSYSAADEVVALQTVLRKIETGRWPSTNPHHLNEAVGQFEPQFQQVPDLGAGVFPFPTKVMPPVFVVFEPPRFLRPSL